ncbi:MAG TPA: membrane dipeptidase [Firmicutes bacterium]|nr:membrane dipeptidase [Bacillota bacterium]
MESGQKMQYNGGIIDAHCDTVHLFAEMKDVYNFAQKNTIAQLDLPRMEAAGIKVQFFALYIEPEYKYGNALKRCMQLLDLFYQTIETCEERIEAVFNYDDLLRVNNEGKIAAILTVEGGEVLEGDLGVLRMLYRLGIRGLGLTWNQRNEIADGVGERETGGGLTRFGKKVVKEMNRMGMIIDLSHISPKGFWDVLKTTVCPVVVSHANAKKICDHYRNLTDDQLKALRENGGVVGLTFYPDFIHDKNPDLNILLDHFEHISEVAGIDHLGIGSDFDGMGGKMLKGLTDVSCLPALIAGLFARGFKEKDLQKILYGNFLRVIRKICNDDSVEV